MPFPERNELKQVSRTVVYVEPEGRFGAGHLPNPALLYASGIAGAETGNYVATGYLGFPASVFIYPAVVVGSEIHQYRLFSSHIKAYLPEIWRLDLSGDERGMIRKAVSHIGWPGAMPLETVPASRKPGYLQGLASRDRSRATIFIIPRGVRMGYEARTIYVTYGVSVYIKDGGGSAKISRLNTATIQTVNHISFPQDIETYNPLTSPTTDALADRMKMLFADNAELFMRAFKKALRTEQAKISCYFADSCL